MAKAKIIYKCEVCSEEFESGRVRKGRLVCSRCAADLRKKGQGVRQMPKRKQKQIKAALLAGRLAVTDPATGYQRSLHAPCPRDRHECGVYRIERSGEQITRVVFRCPICGDQFDGNLKTMFLR